RARHDLTYRKFSEPPDPNAHSLGARSAPGESSHTIADDLRPCAGLGRFQSDTFGIAFAPSVRAAIDPASDDAQLARVSGTAMACARSFPHQRLQPLGSVDSPPQLGAGTSPPVRPEPLIRIRPRWAAALGLASGDRPSHCRHLSPRTTSMLHTAKSRRPHLAPLLVLASLAPGVVAAGLAPASLDEDVAATPQVLEAGALDALARATVFELEVECPVEEFAESGKKFLPTRVQAGVLVGPDGLAITSFAGLRLAQDAEARFGDSKETFGVRFVDANPAADLALIRLSAKRRGARDDAGTDGPGPLATFLALSSSDVCPREEGFALLPGTDATEPAALALSSFVDADEDDLPDGVLALREDANRSATWLAGAPVIDAGGALVGRLGWAMNGRAPALRWLPGSAIGDLCAGAAGRDGEKLGKAEELGRTSNAKVVSFAFPRLDWTGINAKKASALTEIRSLVKDCTCDFCDEQGMAGGEGFKRDKQGKKIPLPKEPCPTCRRTKLQDAKRRWKSVRGAALHLCASSNEVRESCQDRLADAASAIAAANRELFEDDLNQRAKVEMQIVSLKPVVPGTPMAFVLDPGEWVEEPGEVWSEDSRVVVSETFGRLIVRAPRANPVGSGERALVLCSVAGVVTDAEGRNWTVVERATVVPFAAR
ncbi:MAG: hypothetical protein H6828_16680, partial [Planctomycetes bacterium]|nr:hypothetical protein [Planctomycetota bacterium]